MRRLALLSLGLSIACTPLRPLDLHPRDASASPDAGAPIDDAFVAAPEDAFVPVDAGTSLRRTYVVSALQVPTSSDQARSFGLDLDGDGVVDDALGNAFATLSAMGGSAQATTTTALTHGDFILLVEVSGTSWVDGPALARTLRGTSPTPAPCATHDDTTCGRHLSGTGQFAVLAPVPVPVMGAIDATQLDAGPGELVVPLMLSSTPTWITLVGAHLRADIAIDGLAHGILAGGISASDVDAVLVPAMYAAVAEIIARDCGHGSCPDGTSGRTLVGLFDTNHDGLVTLDEYRSNTVVRSLIAPDLDLVGADGTADALSIGLGFAAVAATFDAP